MADKLQQAIALIIAGDKQRGGELLDEILLENPDVELAWLWRSGVVDDDEQRACCLEQVLALNPNNQVARKGLETLRARAQPLLEPVARPIEVVSTAKAALEPPQPVAVVQPVAEVQSFIEVAPDDPAVTEYVVAQLAQQTSRDDLIYALCQRTGMSWPAAEAFVQRVEADRGQEIRGRQRPLLIVVAVFTLLGGVYLFFTNATYLIPILQDPLALALSAPYLWWRVVLLVTGAAMVVGSLLGLWQSFSPSTAPPIVDLAADSAAGDRYKSVDDVFDVGVYVAPSGSSRRRRRRGTRLF